MSSPTGPDASARGEARSDPDPAAPVVADSIGRSESAEAGSVYLLSFRIEIERDFHLDPRNITRSCQDADSDPEDRAIIFRRTLCDAFARTRRSCDESRFYTPPA
jgi:hypothetical protein